MPRTDPDRAAALRNLPAVDRLVQQESLADLPRTLLLREARALVAETRQRIGDGELDATAVAALFGDGRAAELLRRRCDLARQVRHCRVYNATGIVLHTGLGRAPLGVAAVQALVGSAGYAVVEVDPISGERDQRERSVAALLSELTGAAAALVVNNNAAATTLALAALCADREVVISRGELVEIGGGFRIPEVMRRSGCRMVEVGTTNRTHLEDYRQAITPATAALLKVHPSNFRVEGFASVPDLAAVAALAREHGLLAIDDLGSGLLLDSPLPGLDGEPRVLDSVRSGADIVCFSGDKLLGGPQCGILVGDAACIARIRAHPLYRALRCDKLVLAALEATLFVYRDGEPCRELPTLRMLAAGAAELQQRSQELAALLEEPAAAVVASESFAGAGANPARPLPSFAVALPGGNARCGALRVVRPVPVFARVAADAVLLDARTLLGEDLLEVARAVRAAATQ